MLELSSVPSSAKAGVAPAASVAPGRLAGKVAIVTGAAGNIGAEICRRYLAEGAAIAMLGRDAEKLARTRAALLAERDEIAADDGARLLCVAADAADAAAMRAAVKRIAEHFGRLDIVVNNAGSAGPRQRLEDVPITPDELLTLRASGSTDAETVGDAARNLFGLAWNVVRAAVPYLEPGASIVNVSTIFSRTKYYGRVAYVVPKSALNAWSRRLAYELGDRGIRVNTVFPGPIDSERIRNVFASMDALRSDPSGTTANEFFDMMTLARTTGEAGEPERTFPKIADVANTIVFLGSNDSAAINGHNFEITHGMVVRQESRSTLTARPDLRIVDGGGRRILVAGGTDVPDALAIARAHAARGAQVLLGFATDALLAESRALLRLGGTDDKIRAIRFDRRDPAEMTNALRVVGPLLHGAVVLPAHGKARFTAPLAEADDTDVAAFLDDELVGAVAIARTLTRHWHAEAGDGPRPRVIFASNADDGRGNPYADILRSAIEQLVRVWRDESELDARAGKRARADWSGQIVRWTNAEANSDAFAASWTTKLLYAKRRVKPISLYLPESLAEDTGSERATFDESEHLIGMHLGKVALITGGSSGIGGQIGRLLAIAGARVVLAARSTEQLVAQRAAIVDELDAIGYDDAGGRVTIVDGVDVGDDVALDRAFARTLGTYGACDYLINNAGIAGAERMVVDMDLASWRRTLEANLVANFALMARVVPEMKRRGSGYILNVSSYFGGEKYVAVAYPNRADYAVSKAGQRALVETMAQFVGPEIQLNAIAPGPVDGDRLKGSDAKAGLFERRGKLILEARRLNALYAAAIACVRTGISADTFLAAAVRNRIDAIVADAAAPHALRKACEGFAKARPAAADGSYYEFLMDERIAHKLSRRLHVGGYTANRQPLVLAEEAPTPFYLAHEVAREAEKVRSGVLKLLHLNKMPTETDVALATVYFLADRAISGETFQPSGGLRQERSVTERELFGRAKDERVEQMRGKTVWIVGEQPIDLIVRAARTYVEECGVARVVLMTRTAQTESAVLRRLPEAVAARCVSHVIGLDIEPGLRMALTTYDRPAAVASMPFGLLPTALFEGTMPLDGRGFATLLEENVTNHFRVARVVSLFDDVRLVFTAPDVSLGGGPAEFALANFVKTTLHALTATLAVENERLVHEVPVNQINPTRRVLSEEPKNLEEQAEERDRFARAVVLASGPLPHADDSRYRARIYRGMAITV
jgi:malonyl-CoA reductase/3-hydroxypropionate dehydrogenase (NADP+)